MLELKGVCVFHGSVQALHDISLRVDLGEIVTLIGSNGSGKSTTLASIMGTRKVRRGRVLFQGGDITNGDPHGLVRKGIAFSPEGRLLFPGLTVAENLRVGAYSLTDKKQVRSNTKRVFALFPRLEERKSQLAGTLSGGEQQMLSIGRALMSSPKLLLLDEPSLGLAPNLAASLFRLIAKIREEGTTVLLVEQNANMALGISDRGYVLETGRITLADTAARLRSNDRVRNAYLGR